MADHLVRGHRPQRRALSGRSAGRRRRISALSSGRARVFMASGAVIGRAAARRPPRGTRPARARGPPRPAAAAPGSRDRSRSASNCGLRRPGSAPRSSPSPPRAADAARPRSCSPTSQSSQPSWKMASGSSMIFEPAEGGHAADHLRGPPVEPGHAGSRSRSGRPGCATSCRIAEQRRRASSRRPARPRPMTRMPVVAAATISGGSDGQQRARCRPS